MSKKEIVEAILGVGFIIWIPVVTWGLWFIFG